MTTEQTLAEVAPLIGTKWGFAEDYAAFIGPKCVICSRRNCRDAGHLAAVRADVQAVLTVKDLAGVLCRQDEPDGEGEDAGPVTGVTDVF